MAPAGRVMIEGPVGPIEAAVQTPESPRAVAIIAHPHPLFGGTMDNKVATTLARACAEAGAAAWRFNFRGVGQTAGTHDDGRGETDDLIAVAHHAMAQQPGLPLWLCGFSFGGAVALAASERLDVKKMVLVAPAFSRLTHWPHAATGGKPPERVLLIHGEKDDTVALSESMEWARQRAQTVTVVPDADHFFHGRLHIVREVVRRWVAAG
ncbi:MAG: alpha/beta fold hydrolase [Betaproteobacteria bacterium]|nr:alpha/beta fold hydrolase [Betaproteobacteria bacterium]